MSDNTEDQSHPHGHTPDQPCKKCMAAAAAVKVVLGLADSLDLDTREFVATMSTTTAIILAQSLKKKRRERGFNNFFNATKERFNEYCKQFDENEARTSGVVSALKQVLGIKNDDEPKGEDEKKEPEITPTIGNPKSPWVN